MDPFPCEPAIIPPPPPPPAPPILHPLQKSSSGSGSGSGVRRLRSVFWERIPQERVEGKRNVWSESDELLIDLSCLDELFEQPQLKPLGVKGHCDRDKLASKSTSQDNSPEKVCILGERSSLKVGIFMHHVKSNLGEIISDIRDGRGQRYGTEKLKELYKLLPDSDEEQRLRAFKGEHSQLEEADLFMLHLVLIPSYRLRLEAMILQEEFDPTENELHEQEDRCHPEHERVKKAEKRHSIISCSALEEPNKEKDALEIILQTPMDPPRRRSLHSTCHTLLGGVASRQPIKLQSFTKTEASKNKAESLISIDTPPTESNQMLSPSPEPTSSNSSAHFPSLHCLHVGETHALVPSLLSYSSLAPPTKRDHTLRERQEKKQEVTESKQEVTKVKQEVIKKEVVSVGATKPHRGKLSGGMTKSTNQTPPRPSRLPLLRTSSMRPIREAEQYKRPHPVSQLLERTGRERQEVKEEEQEVKMEKVKKIKEQEVVRSRSRLPIRLASPLALASQLAIAVPLTELSTFDRHASRKHSLTHKR
ncbi:hypothetical protein PDJAM_G00259340 [Pangasius djambal]|nr:hypothetical protein [Pangasius djambal]